MVHSLLAVSLLPVALALDFKYYQADNTDFTGQYAGYSIEKWNGEEGSEHDVVLFAPAAVRLTIEPGATYPENADAFYMGSDVTWVVISGNATLGEGAKENATDSIHGYGDAFWAAAGTKHGPVKNVGSSQLVITAVTGGVFGPKFGDEPASNPSIRFPKTTLRSYRRVDGTFRPNPSPHSDECMAGGGVENMNLPGKDQAGPILRVKWAPNCSIPFHYHPTGALYFVQYGKFFFAGDLDHDKTFNAGDIRWVRPGYAYGPEYNSVDEPMEITVMGTDTPPEFSAAPEGPYHVRKSTFINHVYENGAWAAHAFEV